MDKETQEVYDLAKFLHEEYENSARLFGWGSQEVCRVPFDELPEANKKTMLSVAMKVKDYQDLIISQDFTIILKKLRKKLKDCVEKKIVLF